MAAVDGLLRRLDSIDRAVDALSERAFQEAEIQEHLIRGVSVHGLVCVETFVKERIDEWSALIMQSRIPPSRLPNGTKQFEDRIVEVLPRSLKDCEASRRSSLLDEVGKSLTSLSSGVLVPHPLAFFWPGSNIKTTDVENILALVGIDRNKAWSELTRVWSIVDPAYPGNANLKTIFEDVAELRHTGAHVGSPAVPLPNLASVTRSVKLICLCLDTVVSGRVRQLTIGPMPKAQFQVKVRHIREASKDWPEFAPSAKKAFRRHASRGDALNGAVGRARSLGEIVLVWNRSSQVIDWSC